MTMHYSVFNDLIPAIFDLRWERRFGLNIEIQKRKRGGDANPPRFKVIH